MSLKDELETIDGVGPQTAGKVLEIVDAQDTGLNQGYLDKAIQAAEAKDYNTAGIYLRRASE